jgi:hypothetical protein
VQIARATSIPKSDFDEVIDTLVKILAQIGVQHVESSTWHRSALSTLAATSPCRRLLGGVGLCAAYAACASSEELQGHTSCCKVEGGWPAAGGVVPGGVVLVGAVMAEAWAD